MRPIHVESVGFNPGECQFSLALLHGTALCVTVHLFALSSCEARVPGHCAQQHVVLALKYSLALIHSIVLGMGLFC